jgi:hypothetical protein
MVIADRNGFLSRYAGKLVIVPPFCKGVEGVILGCGDIEIPLKLGVCVGGVDIQSFILRKKLRNRNTKKV